MSNTVNNYKLELARLYTLVTNAKKKRNGNNPNGKDWFIISQTMQRSLDFCVFHYQDILIKKQQGFNHRDAILLVAETMACNNNEVPYLKSIYRRVQTIIRSAKQCN